MWDLQKTNSYQWFVNVNKSCKLLCGKIGSIYVFISYWFSHTLIVTEYCQSLRKSGSGTIFMWPNADFLSIPLLVKWAWTYFHVFLAHFHIFCESSIYDCCCMRWFWFFLWLMKLLCILGVIILCLLFVLNIVPQVTQLLVFEHLPSPRYYENCFLRIILLKLWYSVLRASSLFAKWRTWV